MAAAVSQVTVATPEQLEQTVSSYIMQGFVVMNRTPSSATMFKKKEFSILWLVVGLILCVFPLIVYLIIYAAQSDQMVEIVVSTGGYSQPQAAVGQLSPDGYYRWDGARWVPVQQGPATPPTG